MRSKIVLKEKHDGDGNIVKLKARIVAKGFDQVPGQDYELTFASVAKFTTLRMLLSIVAHEDWELHQVDVVGAYLQGDLDEEIYMEVPEGVKEKGKEGWYWKLTKALYGLKQAGHQWKKKLNEIMGKLSLKKSQADDCLYIHHEDGVVALLVLAYVDDMAVAGKNLVHVREFKKNIARHVEITDLGELHYILGIQIKRDCTARTISLNQTAYIRDVLERFGMENSNPVSTPLNTKECLSAAQSPQTTEEKKAYLEYAGGLVYIQIVGSIIYVMQTRPDVLHAVGVLSQFSANPGKTHLESLKRVLRYLKGTAHYTLILGRQGMNSVDLVGWTDSDWAQDPDTRRSIGGFVFDVAGSKVAWSSKKQPTVALSTVESEYMAASNATKEAIWLRVLLEEMGFKQISATTIHVDNQGCIALAHNPVNHSRVKHIDIRHHFIRERVASKEVNLRYVSTKDMLADMFTKQLLREAFERFRDILGVGEH